MGLLTLQPEYGLTPCSVFSTKHRCGNAIDDDDDDAHAEFGLVLRDLNL